MIRYYNTPILVRAEKMIYIVVQTLNTVILFIFSRGHLTVSSPIHDWRNRSLPVDIWHLPDNSSWPFYSANADA